MDARAFAFRLLYDPQVWVFDGAETQAFAGLPAVVANGHAHGQVVLGAALSGEHRGLSGERVMAQVRLRRVGQGQANIQLLDAEWVDANLKRHRSSSEQIRPLDFALLPAYPNPFNPETQIRFTLPQAAFVRLEIYDGVGQRIRSLLGGPHRAGTYVAVWDGRDDAGRAVASGPYFAHLSSAGRSAVRKMLCCWGHDSRMYVLGIWLACVALVVTPLYAQEAQLYLDDLAEGPYASGDTVDVGIYVDAGSLPQPLPAFIYTSIPPTGMSSILSSENKSEADAPFSAGPAWVTTVYENRFDRGTGELSYVAVSGLGTGGTRPVGRGEFSLGDAFPAYCRSSRRGNGRAADGRCWAATARLYPSRRAWRSIPIWLGRVGALDPRRPRRVGGEPSWD